MTLNHNFDVNKSEFQEVVKLRYEWEVPDTPSFFLFAATFSVGITL